MRSLHGGPVLPLLGSLVLHAFAVLLLAWVVRPPVELVGRTLEHTDAWAGSALEVDALATPDAVPTIVNRVSSEAAPAPAAVAPAVPTSAAQTTALPVTKAELDAPPAPPKNHRPRPPPDAAARSAHDSFASSSSARTHEPATQAATGAFGSENLPQGVRSLPSAFTRAIPPATGADPIWQTLPAGQQRAIVIAVQVAADGHIEDSKFVGEHEAVSLPEQFTHLRQRVLALLGGGLFALHSGSSAGYGVFRVTITLSDRAVATRGAPAELVERGFDPPRGRQPGRAYFTLASGRHFEAKVEVLDTPRVAHP